MKLKLSGDFAKLVAGIEELQADYNFTISDSAQIELTCEQQSGSASLIVSYSNSQAHITYDEHHHFFRALGLLLEKLSKGDTEINITETAQFNTVGPMFDLSRNAVMKVDKFKEMIRYMAIMGLDSAMLYMEDTYEVKSEPYFGYMRGRYSQEELEAIDDYSYQFGIEMIPCIQSLAHLEEFLKWDAALPYKDTRGALLLESEPTYTLLENMIEAASAPFRSKRIHIGMDEAEELGRGHYLNRNGYKPRVELMTEHLAKVLEITDELGLETMMWSDMFLKLASETGDVYSSSTVIPEHIIEQTPDNVQLMYWQYNSPDIDHYRNIINQHNQFKKKPAFAGGIWVWNTFATNYDMSIPASDAALKACKEKGVEDVFITLWGDDGFENNFFTALLGFQYYAEHAYTEALDLNEDHLRERVKFCTGIDEHTFLLLNDLDTPPGVEEENKLQTNPSKFMLYQDVLLGLFDKHVEGLDMRSHYEQLSE